jgi:hypothetical protein
MKPAIARFRRAAAVAAITAALPATMAITVTAGAPVAANAQSDGNTGGSAAHKAEFEKIVRDYILRNPEIVAEAIQILRAKKGCRSNRRQGIAGKQSGNVDQRPGFAGRRKPEGRCHDCRIFRLSLRCLQTHLSHRR